MRRTGFPLHWGLAALLLLAALPLAAEEPPGPLEAAPLPSAAPRAWVGIVTVDEDDGGVRIVAVRPGSPAHRAGLRRGDLLLLLAGQPAISRDAVGRVLAEATPGNPLDVQLLRRGRTIETRLVPVRAPEAPRAALPVAPSILGRLAGPLRRVLPVEVVAITPELRELYGADRRFGILVTSTDSRAGGERLAVGDVLVRYCGASIASPQQVVPCDEASPTVEVVRAGRTMTFSVDRAVAQAPALAVVPQPPTPPTGIDVQVRLLESEQRRLERRLREIEQRLRELQGSGSDDNGGR